MSQKWLNSKVSNFYKAGLLTATLLACSASETSAQIVKPEGDEYSLNDFGGIGLLQTRTARVAPDGQFHMGASFINPYRRYFLTWQALPRVEVVFRYTDPTNTIHSTTGIIDQSQKKFFSDILHFRNGNTQLDRGFDLKVLLKKETKFFPAIAIGLQDFIGTGLFAGEYIVATKAVGDFDLTLGIGFGNVGNRGGIKNPLSIISESFLVREQGAGLGGGLRLKNYFSGNRASFFGGVEYFTPYEGLSLKAEYSGSNPEYDRDILASFTHIRESLPINVGINYRASDWFEASIAFERGNSLMVRAAFRANFHRPGIESFKIVPARVMQREEIIAIEQESAALAKQEEQEGAQNDLIEEVSIVKPRPDLEAQIFQRLQIALSRKKMWAYGFKLEDKEATLILSRAAYIEVPKSVGLAARVVNNFLPSNVEKITIVELVGSVETFRVSVMRSDIEKEAVNLSSPEEIWFRTEVNPPLPGVPSPDEYTIYEDTYPNHAWWVTPELKQHIGDPTEGIYIADVDIEAGVSYSPLPGLSFRAVGRRFLFGSLDSIKRRSNSVLPHVRSDIVEYLQAGKTSIKSLQVDYFASLKQDWYFRVAAGLLEPMFGGVGGEALYRPYGKPWAISFDLNWVKQREYKQQFGFRDYETVTGHATLNYDLPYYGLRATVSAGRYLAGDYGATFEVSRRFDNGVRVGAFFTRTNVSAEDFGEGSFDKGFYISFPFSVFLQNNSKQEANFLFRPLTRDGGQKLNIGPSLFHLVDRSNYGVLKREWHDIGQ